MDSSEVLKARQLVLDDFEVDPYVAIELAELHTLHDKRRPISVNMQKRVLKRFASFSTGLCKIDLLTLAMQWHVNERTLRSTVNVLVADETLIEERRGNQRIRSIHWTEIGRRIPRKLPGNSARSSDQETTGQLMADCPVTTGQRARPKEKQGNSQSSTSVMTMKVSNFNWDDAASAIKTVGVDQVDSTIRLAKQRGLGANDVVDIAFVCANVPELSAGAIVTRIRDGVWPRDDVPDVDVLRSQILRGRERKKLERHKQLLERTRFNVMRDARDAGRPLKTESEISAEVERVIALRARTDGA